MSHTNKSKTDDSSGAAFDKAGVNVIETDVRKEAEDSYLEYAYSVIHSRALPDARDGLKPVHRRILYSMHETGLRPDHAHVKSARVVGECFTAGARVHTRNGTVPIEELNLGDYVLTPDGEETRVVQCYENPPGEIVVVSFADGRTIEVTPGQLFKITLDDFTTQWEEAKNLLGKHVLTLHTKHDNSTSYEPVEVIEVKHLTEHKSTFDIQIDSEDHAFVVEDFIVHNCMGKFHPHGDSAIYDSLVRMAQNFSLNTPLVDGHGNFGSPNDAAAAQRYTECRLSKVAMLMVEELNEGTVDYAPNYDGSLQEPTVLPAAFPYLLVNGGAGIAVGMATNMIPHNLGEAIEGARMLIKKPNASLDELMKVIPGPDLPTGGELLGMDQVRQAYETGKGTVRLRAKLHVEPIEGSRGRNGIIVTELPYSIGTERVIDQIKTEIGKKRLQGVSDIKDLSDRRHGTRLLIECKTGVNPQALIADLWKYTPLEVSFGISNLALVDGHPRTLGLKEMLEVFLKHRYEVVRRRTQFRLDKAEARKHIVEGLLTALENIDAVVKIIRGSKDTTEARAALIKKFKLSDIQAGHILDMPLRRLVGLEVETLRKEHAELVEAIAGFLKILNDEKVLRAVVDKELATVYANHAEPRRTILIDGNLQEVLAASAPAVALEVSDDPCEVVLSTTGLLARTAAASEEAKEGRKRSGRAKHDAILSSVKTTARKQVLLVTNKGRAFKVDVLSLPALPDAPGTVSLRGGVSGSELVALTSGERVVTIAPYSTEKDKNAVGLALGTKQGFVKVCAPDWPLRSDEFEIMGLKNGDEIVGGRWLKTGKEELVFVASDSQLLHFPAAKVRPQGRSGGGMAGMKLAEGQNVVSFTVVNPESTEYGEHLVVTYTGASVKVTPLAEYPSKGRATGGVRSHKFLKGEDRIIQAWVGARPVASSRKGDPVELPEVNPRRDGSGTPVDEFELIGHHYQIIS